MKKSILLTKLLIWSLPGIIRFIWRKITTGKGREINTKSISNFLDSKSNQASGQPHVEAQYKARLEVVALKSPDCLTTGECKCGCAMPEKLYEPEGCEYGCYGPMLNKEDYEKSIQE